jgi:hypothetical protein
LTVTTMIDRPGCLILVKVVIGRICRTKFVTSSLSSTIDSSCRAFADHAARSWATRWLATAR